MEFKSSLDSSLLKKYEKNIDELGDGNQLLKSLVESEDEELVNASSIVNDALNQGISSFTPSAIFEQMVQNFSIAKSLFGNTLVRELTGYNVSEIEKNINIPEFQKELRSNIVKRFDKLKELMFVSDDGTITEKGTLAGAVLLFKEELDKLVPEGFFGEKISRKSFIYGDKVDVKDFRKGNRYRDIAIKRSAKTALRRGHRQILFEDLKAFEKESRGGICVVYAIDASSSMKGDKIELCKKAGIALAYKAVEAKDKVGLIVFGTEVKDSVAPSDDFGRILVGISGIKASRETNIHLGIKKAVELFPSGNMTKHLIILTDAMPTVGNDPEKETLEAVSFARNSGITVSVIGIKLDKKAAKFAEDIAMIGEGRFYVVRDVKNLDMVVLDDYYTAKN